MIFMTNKTNSMAHTKWICQYHLSLLPSIDEKQFIINTKKIYVTLQNNSTYKGVDIIEGHLMPDHIHILVSIPSKYSVSSFMRYLKGKSALMIFDKPANLKYKYGNRYFWAEGYYISTVGPIKKYIQDQEKSDIMQDKLSVKQYENHFKGEPVLRTLFKG